MFQQYDDPESWQIRRVDQPSAIARHRYALLLERQNSSGHLSYALVLLFLFQTLLLAFVALFLGALVLFSFIGVSFRAQETAQMSIVLTRMVPLVGTPTVVAMLPAPTGTLAGPATLDPALPLTTVPPPIAPTPEVLATPTLVQPPALESPLPPPTVEAAPPTPVAPGDNPPIQPADLAALQTYNNQVNPPIDQLSTAIESLRGFAQNPNFADPQWIANVTAQIGIIRNAQASLQAAQPPPLGLALHNELINAVNSCRSAADIFDQIMATSNVAELNTVNTSLQTCLATFPQASSRLRDYIRNPTGQPR